MSISDGSFKSVEYSRLLLNIPIDTIFTLSSKEISKLLSIIYVSYHNQEIGYFFWKNSLDNSLQVVLSVPEKNYSVDNMTKVIEYICEYFGVELIDTDVNNSLAGYWIIYYYFICEDQIKKTADEKSIVKSLNNFLKQWYELLEEHVIKYNISISPKQLQFYRKVFPSEYTKSTPIKLIAIDIQNLERAIDEDKLVLYFVTPEDNIYKTS